MEVRCPGTWGLELPTPTQVARAPQKPALPETSHEPRQPYPAPAPVTQSQNSMEITITVIINNNKNNSNNNKVIKTKRGEEGGRKHSEN